MEENYVDMVENGRINRLICGTLDPMDDNFDDVHDVVLIDTTWKYIYEGVDAWKIPGIDSRDSPQ